MNDIQSYIDYFNTIGGRIERRKYLEMILLKEEEKKKNIPEKSEIVKEIEKIANI